METIRRKCKSSIGGIKAVWLLKWQKYPRSLIQVSGNYLIGFPDTFIHKFESITPPVATETIQENDGGKFYEQSITMSFKSDWSREFAELMTSDYRLVFLDNNGFYRIFGLYSGMRSDAINFASGGTKGELNGYTFTLNGQEETESLFIESLEGLGLTEETFYLLFQDGDNIVTQANDKLILKENG